MPIPAFEAETHDNAQTAASVTFTSPAIVDANFALVLLVYERDSANIESPSATFDGVACTYIDWNWVEVSDNYWGVVMWYVENPGSAKEVVISWTNNAQIGNGVCCTYTIVRIGDPIGTVAKATGTGTAISVEVASQVNDLVVDAASQNTDSATVGAGQTERVNYYVTAARAMVSDEPGAAAVTMSWATGDARGWATMGVPLKPQLPGSQVLIFA